MSNEEIIVRVGAEGGDLTLYGARTGNGWLFKLNVYDCTPLLLDDDEAGPATQQRSSPVTSWADAIGLLDRYPWAKLHPRAVHAEFRQKVWSEVQRRLDHDTEDDFALDRWRRVCEVDTENWLDSYYEALEFFYWEPQHMKPKTHAAAELETLAKLAKQSSKVDDVKAHLRAMEVTLNHNIRQFLLLAPDALRNSLFEKIFGRAFDGAFALYGREIDKFALVGCMQPDFLFVSEAEVVSVEMKVKAKCSVDQVLKYALLGLAIEMKEGKAKPKKHYLILLGKGVFANQWAKRFEAPDKLTEAIASEDLAKFLHNKPRHFRERQQLFSQIVEQMQVEFVNYERLGGLLRDEFPAEGDQSPGAEVYRKLISGLVDEFKRRHLS